MMFLLVSRPDIEAEHECPVCHKRYHTKPVLKQHMVVHGEKSFLCSDCGKGFYSKATLQAHSKVFVSNYFQKIINDTNKLINKIGSHWG